MFAGQLSGVEGYTESIATGLLAGIYAAALARGEEPVPVPRATALGSLVHYITHADPKDFQPANITFDLLEPLEEELRKKVRDKKERHRMQCERALAAFDAWWTASTEQICGMMWPSDLAVDDCFLSTAFESLCGDGPAHYVGGCLIYMARDFYANTVFLSQFGTVGCGVSMGAATGARHGRTLPVGWVFHPRNSHRGTVFWPARLWPGRSAGFPVGNRCMVFASKASGRELGVIAEIPKEGSTMVPCRR